MKVESKVLQELTLPDGGMSGWEVETQRFVGNEEKINYQAVDIYKPHVPAVAS